MVRNVRRSVCMFLALAVAVAWLAPATQAKEPHPIVQLAKKMAQPIDFPGSDNPKMTLRDALDMLAKKYDVRFDVVVVVAVAEAGSGGVAANDKPAPASKPTPPDKPVPPAKPAPAAETPSLMNRPLAALPMPKMTQVRLGSVLQKILDRASPPEFYLTYILRRDGIEITTSSAVAAEFYPDEGVVDPVTGQSVNPLEDGVPVNIRRLFPLVQVEFDTRPLGEALQELADATDWTVVLDGRAAEQAKPVTATLVNVPLDTAVEMLADLAGLTVMRRNKSMYVTTKENAVALQKARMERSNPQAGMRMGGGMAGLGGMGGIAGGFGGMGGLGGMGGMGGMGGIGGMGGMAGVQGGMLGIGGGLGGFQGGGGIGSQPPASPSQPSAPKPATSQETAKSKPPDVAKMQAEIVKLQAEIAKLQGELSRLQPKQSEPKQENRDRPKTKEGPRPDPADRGKRSAFMKQRGHPTPKG